MCPLTLPALGDGAMAASRSKGIEGRRTKSGAARRVVNNSNNSSSNQSSSLNNNSSKQSMWLFQFEPNNHSSMAATR